MCRPSRWRLILVAALSLVALAWMARAPASAQEQAVAQRSFEARKADGTIVLSGHVPSAASLELMEAAARRVGTTTGAPALAADWSPKVNFDRLAELGFVLLGRIESGWLRVADDGLSFGGVAPQAEAEAIRGALRRAGVKLGRIDLADPNAAACRDRVATARGGEEIEFPVGSAKIAPASSALISRLAQAIKLCTNAIEIAGRGDEAGDSAGDLLLARQRAEAVARALAEAGAPAARLAVAQGAAKPPRSDDSAADRAKYRRIEFTLK